MNKNIISQLFLCILTMCTIISCKDNINVSCKQESYTAEDSIAVINVSYKTLLSQNKDLNLWFQRINDSLSTKFKASADTVREMSKEDRKFLREDFPPYSFYVKDSTFNLSDKLVSERYTVYTYSGGAHGYTYFISLNLLPDKMIDLSKEQMFKNDQNSVKEINQLLDKHFNRMDCFFEQPTLELVSVVNFNMQGVLFTFEHYVLGPYACGEAEIFIPKDEIFPFLKNDLAAIYSK